jgi:hypothetical protein
LPTLVRPAWGGLEGNSSCSFNRSATVAIVSGNELVTHSSPAPRREQPADWRSNALRGRGACHLPTNSWLRGLRLRPALSPSRRCSPSGRACVSSVSRRARMSVAVYQWHRGTQRLCWSPHRTPASARRLLCRLGAGAGRGRRACRPPRETRLALGGRSVHRERKGNPGATGRRRERAPLCGILPPYWQERLV